MARADRTSPARRALFLTPSMKTKLKIELFTVYDEPEMNDQSVPPSDKFLHTKPVRQRRESVLTCTKPVTNVQSVINEVFRANHCAQESWLILTRRRMKCNPIKEDLFHRTDSSV